MKKKLVGLSVVFLFLLLALTNAQAAILKVGTSWSGTQYGDIQSAVNAASASDEIWVEQGTYTLDGTTYTTIDISKAIALYGGFTGSETSRDQRDATANTTTVDGSNSVTCFFTTSTVTLDGLSIINGYGATGTPSDEGGGGIVNGECTSWVGSKSTKYCEAGTPGYLTVANCTFANNDSLLHGGAIISQIGSIQVTNCTFSENTASNRGAGICNYTSMTVEHCTFSQNTAPNGTAIVSNNTTNDPAVNITDSVFSYNTSSSDGSAIMCDASLTVARCIFDHNTGGRAGCFAARGDTGYAAVFTNCVFSNNSALNGAGICINGTSGNMGVVKAVNCTFTGNTVTGKGSAIYTSKPYTDTNTDFAVTNSILWGNSGNAIEGSTTTRPLPIVSYSDLGQTGYAGTLIESINEDPLFVDAANGDYSLQATSPCKNTGTATGAPAEDILKVSRPQGSGFDMGAYEYVVTLVSLSAFDAAPGNRKVTLTWTTESEIDNAGFNIYRAEAGGEYVKINEAIIPAEGAAAMGASYVFVDEDAQNRATYSYKLEDVDTSDISTLHEPVTATPRLIYGILNN